jgi:hypothetical protein
MSASWRSEFGIEDAGWIEGRSFMHQETSSGEIDLGINHCSGSEEQPKRAVVANSVEVVPVDLQEM